MALGGMVAMICIVLCVVSSRFWDVWSLWLKTILVRLHGSFLVAIMAN